LEEGYLMGDPHGRRTKYYANGTLKFTGVFENSNANGVHKTWYETGSQCLEEVFKNDQLHGICTQWFPQGFKYQTTYRNNLKEGVKKIWNGQGRLISEENYRRNLLHGRSLYWHSNGQLKMRVQNFAGIRHGVMSNYDETGKLLDKKVFIRGVAVSNRLNNLIKSGELSAAQILNEQNLEVRRICIEELGYAKFLSQVNHAILDKQDEYELIRIFLSEREEAIHLVKVKCPSTGAFYTLRVPPSMKTVKEAVAWTFGVEEDKYNPEIET
jgi:antitoxin component YwqK of YwqJK toxin-antitoxin module